MKLAGYQALRQSCGLWQRPAVKGVLLSGEDRLRLLNGLVTCEVKGLSPGQGVRGFFTDVKGHILSPVVVRAIESRLWLELPVSTVALIAEHIEKYIVADRVEVSLSDEWAPLALIGPGAGDLVGRLGAGTEAALAPWGHRQIEFSGQRYPLTDSRELGAPAFTLWARVGSRDQTARAIRELADPDEVEIVNDEAVEVLRVERAAPLFDTDYGSENLPQETGMDDTVSFTKGCFLGQEVVARLQYRGQVARRVSRLGIEGTDPPPVGSKLFLDDREAGSVTSAVRLPAENRIAALAMLQRRALEPGTDLVLQNGSTAHVL